VNGGDWMRDLIVFLLAKKCEFTLLVGLHTFNAMNVLQTFAEKVVISLIAVGFERIRDD
jgi:hypothetical protein